MNGSHRHDTRRAASALTCAPPRSPRVRAPLALLIDGEPVQARRHASRLRADGYAVVSATGLQAGLDLAARRRPDLVFVCLGSWAVPTLVVLALRSSRATSGLPTVLVANRSRAELAREVGGLLPTEHVVAHRPGPEPPEVAPADGTGSRCSRWHGVRWRSL